MGKFGSIQEDFYTERTRILDALDTPEYRHVVMRLIGALAFRTHCPEFGTIQDALGRKFTDFDFASYPRFLKEIQHVLGELGYEEDKMVTRLFSDSRMLFHDPSYGRHIDIFFDRLDFCHVLPLTGRLEVEKYTLPLAELVLEKMQIVQINEKDLIDVIMLFREHPVGDTDMETINAPVIVRLLAKDWGFWRTVTGNLRLVKEQMEVYSSLTQQDKDVVLERIGQLEKRIAEAPKSPQWKARSLVGDRIRWYKDVEELMDR